MSDLRIEPATSCTAVERGYDRASQPGIYFTMTLERRTNGYDQDLCVLAKNSLIWIYTFLCIYTAVERGYDRASQAGMYFTMTLDRSTNGYDQDLCVLAKNSLIWIYTFYANTWPFKIIDNVVYYTTPQATDCRPTSVRARRKGFQRKICRT